MKIVRLASLKEGCTPTINHGDHCCICSSPWNGIHIAIVNDNYEYFLCESCYKQADQADTIGKEMIKRIGRLYSELSL
jgi:hypothetical protein